MCRFALVLCICAHTFHKEFLLVSSKIDTTIEQLLSLR
jgi:hypothetical protein